MRALQLLCCVGLAVTAPAQVRLVGYETATASLVELDTLTGAATIIGPLVGLSGHLGALAYDQANGRLYASNTQSDTLQLVDVATLTVTTVGPFTVDPTIVAHGLAFDGASGQLFAKSTAEASAADFFEVTPQTGQAAPRSLTGIGGLGGIQVVGGTLYFCDTVQDRLMTIDLATGVAAPVGPLGFDGNVGTGLAYHPAHGLLATDNVTDRLYRIDTTTGGATVIGAQGTVNVIGLEFIGGGSFGLPYCMGAPNSTGAVGRLEATGSLVAALNQAALRADALPPATFAFALVSRTRGFVPQPGGSAGNLCLGSGIGRYVGPGQIQSTGSAGTFALALDLAQTPTPTGPAPALAGETWRFQVWHRDVAGGAATSNFTRGLEVTWQ